MTRFVMCFVSFLFIVFSVSAESGCFILKDLSTGETWVSKTKPSLMSKIIPVGASRNCPDDIRRELKNVDLEKFSDEIFLEAHSNGYARVEISDQDFYLGNIFNWVHCYPLIVYHIYFAKGRWGYEAAEASTFAVEPEKKLLIKVWLAVILIFFLLVRMEKKLVCGLGHKDFNRIIGLILSLFYTGLFILTIHVAFDWTNPSFLKIFLVGLFSIQAFSFFGRTPFVVLVLNIAPVILIYKTLGIKHVPVFLVLSGAIAFLAIYLKRLFKKRKKFLFPE